MRTTNPPVYTLTSLIPQPLLSATLARRAAEYRRIEARRTEATWDAVEVALAQIVMTVPTGQRRSFHRLVREAKENA